MRFTEYYLPAVTLWMAKHDYVAHGGRLFVDRKDAEEWAATLPGMVVFPVTAWGKRREE